jgi:nucleotide-binding universal stress UspA family protein
MPDPSQVVVAYDFTHSSHSALLRAITVAARAPWHVLHVISVIHPRHPFPSIPGKHVDLAYADRVQEAVTAQVRAELGALGIEDRVSFFVYSRIGRRPAKEILQLAEEVGAELILCGSNGQTGVERALIGSTAERIVRDAGCTVEVIKPKRYSYVPRLAVTEVEPHHGHYEPPHRYSYEDARATRRPNDWPLY